MNDTLPPLPEPDYWSTRDDDTPLFTADQMRDYARAALAAAQPAPATGAQPYVEALAHRIAWRYKKSSDPHHSDTYTFNKTTLRQFADELAAAHTGSAAPIDAGEKQ